MKKKVEKLLAVSLAALSYAVPLGLGAWHAVQRRSGVRPEKGAVKPAKDPEPEEQNVPQAELGSPSPREAEKLESLSFSTPGNAPLDHLARVAAREEHEKEHAALEISESPASAQPYAPENWSVEGLLHYQSLASNRLAGWTVPMPEKLPIPTFVPAVMAFGIVVFAMGLATVWYVCVVGALVFAVAAWRWTAELQGE